MAEPCKGVEVQHASTACGASFITSVTLGHMFDRVNQLFLQELTAHHIRPASWARGIAVQVGFFPRHRWCAVFVHYVATYTCIISAWRCCRTSWSDYAKVDSPDPTCRRGATAGWSVRSWAASPATTTILHDPLISTDPDELRTAFLDYLDYLRSPTRQHNPND